MVKPQQSWWAGWWPARPAWQAAFSAVLLLAGALGGHYALAPRGAEPRGEMAQLKDQVENLRQLVALSMLNQSSPSARLRGVNYAYQMQEPDKQVEQALLYTVNHDSNVNVRLSAVDALTRYAGNSEVRRAMVDSIALQDSPLVQVVLIDATVQMKNRDAGPALEKLIQNTATDPEVRERAQAGLEKLEMSK